MVLQTAQLMERERLVQEGREHVTRSEHSYKEALHAIEQKDRAMHEAREELSLTQQQLTAVETEVDT